MKADSLHGLSAEFETPEQLVTATAEAYQHGFRKMDAYAPFAVEELAKALGKKNRLPLLVLCGGIVGAAAAYFMQWYANLVSYPLNVGGRPLHSWPAFVPITFELTVLSAALTAFFFSLALSGLPQPYHPMFNVRAFERASQDRFFLCIEANDPQFDSVQTREFLEQLGPVKIEEVPK